MMTNPFITHWSQAKTEEEEAEWWDHNSTRLSMKAGREGRLERGIPGKISRHLRIGPRRVRHLTNLDRGRLKAAELGIRRYKRTL